MPSEALQALIASKRANPYDPSKSIDALRAESDAAAGEPAPGTSIEPCDAGGVYAEWVVSGKPSTEAVFMYIHGGGYYRGSAKGNRVVASYLSAACRCRCFSIDYRLAPEHAFPAAVDDTWTAYRWLLDQGMVPAQIVVGGISAGGGLTAALLAKIKLAGDAQPAAAVPMSPWTDLTQSAETFASNAHCDPSISKAYLDRMAEQYLGGSSPTEPLASPVFSDLSGLPPMLVQVGRAETMFGDAEAYVAKAKMAGVDVELDAYDHVIHGWQNSAHLVPEAREAIERVAIFFRNHTS